MRIRVTDASELEDGVYEATCVEVAEDAGKFGAQVRFTFQLQDGGRYRLWCPISSRVDSKLVRTVAALTGKDYAAGDEFDVEECAGKACRVRAEGGKLVEVLQMQKPEGQPKPASPLAGELGDIQIRSAKNRLRQLGLLENFQEWWRREGSRKYTPVEISRMVLEMSTDDLKAYFGMGLDDFLVQDAEDEEVTS